MQSKTRVPRSRNSVTRGESVNSLNIFSSNGNVAAGESAEFDSDYEDSNENEPLLGSKPVNPNSALAYRQIKLPSSSLMPNNSPKQSRPTKKTKKTLHTAHELTSDLYSTESPSASQGTPHPFALQDSDPSLPELQLTKASLDLEKDISSKSL